MPIDRDSELVFKAELSRRQLLRRLGIGGLALTLPGVLAACGTDSATEAPQSETSPGVATDSSAETSAVGASQIETLAWALSSPPRSLDFYHSFDLATPTILSLCLEGLLVYGPDLQLQPSLAESWSQPDATTYVYVVRDGVTFWDGSSLTAEDIAFSMQRNLDADVGSELATYYAQVDTIEATGPLEVTVRLKSPDPLFQYVPAFIAGYVVQKKFIEEHPDDLGAPDVLTMGTGAYMIAEFSPEENITLVPNENYWGDPATISELNISFVTEPNTRLLALQSGEIDGAFEVPLLQLEQWQQIESVDVQSTEALQVYFFYFNVDEAPWNDIHVRRAIAHALDKQGIVAAVLGGQGVPAPTLAGPPAMWTGLLPPESVTQLYESLPAYPFDLDAARKELDQSTSPSGFEWTIETPDAFPDLTKSALVLSEALGEIGITLTVEERPFNGWLAKQRTHEGLGFEVSLYYADFPDPANLLGISLDSSHAVPNDFNTANYKNPEVDDLLAQQAVATSPEERGELLSQIATIAATDLPYLPIYYPNVAMAIKSEFVYESFGPFYPYQHWASYISEVQ